ncbi:nuclear transport factor 2 family protein [Ensifer sp. YR511]|uniref:nuclear transport factor 2 family protein n=1 Tax=Ensifer sp. YR511 TaxID=1855294 RepID=UPI0008862927|nr:nuclear transport factor 2 family protein [Ensifer sp. YR511]SDN02953.1 hypothetical protein SAMN05216328_11732 [Ensifer sp. YR511]
MTIDKSDVTLMTRKVLEHHMGAFAAGVDEILADYTDESVVITPKGVVRGLSELRVFFQEFIDNATPAFWDAYVLQSKVCDGDYAFITWTAKPFLTFATDTFLIRDGKILMQTFASLAV